MNKKKLNSTEQFTNWYKREKSRGLEDIKFFAKGKEDSTVDGFLKEVNQVLEAETVDDPEIF